MVPVNKEGAVIDVVAAMKTLAEAGYDVSNMAPPPQRNTKKIRLVFYGDAPNVATGFGKVSSNILPALYDSGDYEIYCFGVNYLGVPHKYPFQIYPMLPNPQNDPYGREKITHILPQMEFDIVFFLQDSFILTFIPNLVQHMRQQGKKFKTLAYFPVDGKPWHEWVQAMSGADVPVTYTNWGKKQCQSVYPDIAARLQVVPHGISLSEFFPHPPEKIQQLRKMYFGHHADKFIVINVNRNQPRKDIPRCMMAFKEFQKDCPASVLYLHCAEKDVGWDLKRVAEHIGLEFGRDVLFPSNFNVNSGVPVQVVNDLYNCANACVSCALGEGWGLSSVEAMATKTPCVFPDNTSLSEIFADGRGFLCRSGDTINFQSVLVMDNEVIRPLTNINDMVKHLKRLYEKPDVGFRVAEKAYDWVVHNLQWEKHIIPRFDRIIKDLYEDLKRDASQPLQVGMDINNNWQQGEVV